MVSLWAEPGEGGRLFVQEGADDRAAGGPQGRGEEARERERVTLGVEMSLVFPTSHSKDPVDLVWVGRVEEDRLPWALRAKSRSQGGRDL